MNASRFNDIVRNRARERVNTKVIKFRAAVIKAVCELDPNIYPEFSPGPYDQNSNGWYPQTATKGELGTILSNVAKGLTFDAKPAVGADYPRLKWPRRIFDAEEAAVTKELLATMDEMQRALCAPAPEATSAEPEASPENEPAQ